MNVYIETGRVVAAMSNLQVIICPFAGTAAVWIHIGPYEVEPSVNVTLYFLDAGALAVEFTRTV